MPNMTMEEFLNTITTNNSPLTEQGLPDEAAIAAQIREAMEARLPLLQDPDKQKDILQNLWTVNDSYMRPMGDLGPDPYAELARRVAMGTNVVMPLSWTEGKEGMIPDAKLYGADPGREDMFLLGGGAYQGRFYLQAMDQTKAMEIMDLECPLKEPGFWDKFVDFFRKIFFSRDQVCAQWEDYYGDHAFDAEHIRPLREGSRRVREELRETKTYDLEDALREPDWNNLSGDNMVDQIKYLANDEALDLTIGWLRDPSEVYRNLLRSIQIAACEDLCSRKGALAMARENPQAIRALMKDLKAYVFEHVSAGDVKAILEDSPGYRQGFNGFGKQAYAQYKLDVAQAVSEGKQTLTEKGLLRHEDVKQINPVTSLT